MSYIDIGLDKGALCDYCNRKIVGLAREIGQAGWDWFTGYLPATKHACPNCQSNPLYIGEKDQAYKKPALSNTSLQATAGAVRHPNQYTKPRRA